jgi:hypothetical protein
MWQMREINFDSAMISTPDWLWEDPAREELYDAVKAEYEIDARMEALNQQLDYAEGAMTSIKEDRQHRHSLFVEYAIVLLICIEIGIEIYCLYRDGEPRGGAPQGEPSPPPSALAAPATPQRVSSQPDTCLAASAYQRGEKAQAKALRRAGSSKSERRERPREPPERHVV